MRRFGIAFILVAIIAAAGWWFTSVRVAKAPGGGQACTEEAKLCPDGSYVGRTGPNCEFAACPGVVTATSTTGGGPAPLTSGVRGVVTLGPTCPVMRDPPDPNCADKPYATAITIYRTGSNSPYIVGSSDKSGVFEFSLPPGSYILKAGSGTIMPSCPRTDITVAPDAYTAVGISCDTGIR